MYAAIDVKLYERMDAADIRPQGALASGHRRPASYGKGQKTLRTRIGFSLAAAETSDDALSGSANQSHYDSVHMRSMCFAEIQQATLQHPPQKIVFVSELVE
jgi:hypothetical protein